MFQVLLVASCVALLCCTGFLVLVAIAAFRFRRQRADQLDLSLPAVSMLKPLCGLEPNLETNLASFFQQQYPCFEIIFGVRTNADPAIAVVAKLREKYPHVPVKIAFSGEPEHPNAKVCSLVRMYEKAEHDYIVISDSDVQVSPNYLRDVVRPLLERQNGLVTCL